MSVPILLVLACIGMQTPQGHATFATLSNGYQARLETWKETHEGPHPFPEFAKRMRAIVERDADAAEALDPLLWILELRPLRGLLEPALRDTLFVEVVEDLEEVLIDHPDLIRKALPRMRNVGPILGVEATVSYYSRLAEVAPTPEVKAFTLYYPAVALYDREEEPEPGSSAARDRSAAVAMFREIVEETPETEAGRAAASFLFEVDHLGVGDPAPQISGTMPDGSTVRLTDFRGKVVILDFWGLWCVPCVEMIPELAAQLTRFGADRLVILGINSDEMNGPTLIDRLRTAGVTWPQIQEGTDRAISRAWNVEVYPKMYVIDADGVIRARNVRSEEGVRAALERLLGEGAGAVTGPESSPRNRGGEQDG